MKSNRTHRLKSATVLLIFLLLSVPYSALALIDPSTTSRKFQVVIDPGHGGTDEGTVYRRGRLRVAEKDITLGIALETARQLRKKGYKVTLTRQRDEELSLPARTALANRLKADAFISIHINSAASQTEGFETYILNHTSDASSRRLASLENSVISSEEAHSPQDQDIALILKDLRLDANLSKSKFLACQVQNQIISATSDQSVWIQSPGLQPKKLSGPIPKMAKADSRKLILAKPRDRGVKQALFHVLLGADMPSILVEAGFLNNIHDRTLMLSQTGRALISQAIARGIEQFRTRPVRVSDNCKIN